MKRFILLLLIIACLLGTCSCGKNKDVVVTPDIKQISNICNIATLECYYHNVAMDTKDKGTGFQHIFDSDQECWIEYSGKVTLGIDGNSVDITTSGNQIEITLPKAKILRYGFDENQDFVVYSKKGNVIQELINSNKISADEKTEMIKNAQETMKQTAEENEYLLQVAESKAKEIIENYINSIGELSNVEYNITWKYQ